MFFFFVVVVVVVVVHICHRVVVEDVVGIKEVLAANAKLDIVSEVLSRTSSGSHTNVRT